MFSRIFNATATGNRNRNLDRYHHIEKSSWSISYVVDGYNDHWNHYCGALDRRLRKTFYLLPDDSSPINLVDNVCETIDRLSNRQGRACLALFLATEENLKIIHAGDARVYFIDRGERTLDHSIAQEYANNGIISQDMVQNHPLRNRVTRYLSSQTGSRSLVFWDMPRLAFEERVLLCTDGFWRCFDDQEIFDVKCEASARNAFDKVSSQPDSDNYSILLLKSS